MIATGRRRPSELLVPAQGIEKGAFVAEKLLKGPLLHQDPLVQDKDGVTVCLMVEIRWAMMTTVLFPFMASMLWRMYSSDSLSSDDVASSKINN